MWVCLGWGLFSLFRFSRSFLSGSPRHLCSPPSPPESPGEPQTSLGSGSGQPLEPSPVAGNVPLLSLAASSWCCCRARAPLAWRLWWKKLSSHLLPQHWPCCVAAGGAAAILAPGLTSSQPSPLQRLPLPGLMSTQGLSLIWYSCRFGVSKSHGRSSLSLFHHH